MNEIKLLRTKIDEIDFPENVININGEIKGIAFFPCGDGLVDDSKCISNKKYMILGHDQDNEAGFATTRKKGEETYSSTWKNMRNLLKEANIAEEDCFFTNFLLGIRKGSDTNTGKSPTLKNPLFLNECANFLIEQLKIQKPKAIICLGFVPFKLLGLLSRGLLLKNIGMTEFKEIDKWQAAISKGMHFELIPDFETNIGVIYHPSYRNLNKGKRRYGAFKGNLAEVKILEELQI